VRLRQTIRDSFEALGGEKPIPIWQLHDAPNQSPFTIQEIFQPICEALENNLIRYVGVSNFNLQQLKEAQTYVDIHSVQNVFSFFKRQAEHDGVLHYCEEQQITFLAYSPFGGRRKHRQIGKIKVFLDLAKKYQCSPHCIALAWLLSKSPCLVPIPAASRLITLEDAVRAIDIPLDPADIELINQTKYP
jgi:aryl-alcohol dehydrogenase-like predicted oxidoreductase